MTSWLRFDDAVLNTVNNDISFLILYNLFIDNFRPEFLSKQFDYELIAYTIVKRSYSSDDLTDAFMEGTDAYAYASTLLKCENGIPVDDLGKLDTFASYKTATQDYATEEWGLVDFLKLTFMDFETWRGGEELDLIITFGGGRIGKGINFHLQERVNLYLNERPTPTPEQIDMVFGEDDPPPILNTTKTTTLPTADVTNYFNDGYEVTLNADGNVFATSAKPLSAYETSVKPLSSFRTEVGQERVEVFANKTGSWESLGNPTNLTENELFGTSISLNLDGSILAVGSPGYNDGAGCVRVYRYNGVDRWEQLGLILEGDPSDEFGYDVKINYIGDIILVGCPEIIKLLDLNTTEILGFNLGTKF